MIKISNKALNRLADYEQTDFGEIIVAQNKSSFNLKPTWGISELRDKNLSSGGTIEETEGELKLSTGTTGTNTAILQTVERGQYIAGSTGEFGIGVRIPSSPTGNQEARWGYFDDDNGFGFGIDATGLFVFIRRKPDATVLEDKIYQSNWNVNTLSSNGVRNKLTGGSGNIWQADFAWYGYGDIIFKVYFEKNRGTKIVPLHYFQVTDRITIVDPNQPLTVEARNEGTASNFDVYVGGRQYSSVGGTTEPEKREVSDILSAYTISASNGVWEPVVAIKKKDLFRNTSTGRPNTVQVQYDSISIKTDNPIEFKVEKAQNLTTSGTFNNPNGWGDESAVEVQLATNATFTSSNGYPIKRGFADSGESKGNTEAIATTTTVSKTKEIDIGDEIVVWVKKTTTNATEITVIIEWTEAW